MLGEIFKFYHTSVARTLGWHGRVHLNGPWFVSCSSSWDLELQLVNIIASQNLSRSQSRQVDFLLRISNFIKFEEWMLELLTFTKPRKGLHILTESLHWKPEAIKILIFL